MIISPHKHCCSSMTSSYVVSATMPRGSRGIFPNVDAPYLSKLSAVGPAAANSIACYRKSSTAAILSHWCKCCHYYHHPLPQIPGARHQDGPSEA